MCKQALSEDVTEYIDFYVTSVVQTTHSSSTVVRVFPMCSLVSAFWNTPYCERISLSIPA